jgi:hypothetical protein
VAADRVAVDTPSQNLESYFLEVVARARQAAAETSGAMSGARVAAYLQGEAVGAASPDRILARLTAPSPAPAVPAPAPVEPAVDVGRLRELMRPDQPAGSAAPPEKVVPAKAGDLAQANEKLSQLTRKGN